MKNVINVSFFWRWQTMRQRKYVFIDHSNKGKTPISSAKSTISGINKNSKQVAGKKRQNAEEEETRKAQRLLDEEAERQDAEMQAKKDNSVEIRMPNGPLMRMNKNKAAELSQEKGKDLIKLAKKTNKAKTSPTKSPRKPKSAKKKQLVISLYFVYT